MVCAWNSSHLLFFVHDNTHPLSSFSPHTPLASRTRPPSPLDPRTQPSNGQSHPSSHLYPATANSPKYTATRYLYHGRSSPLRHTPEAKKKKKKVPPSSAPHCDLPLPANKKKQTMKQKQKKTLPPQLPSRRVSSRIGTKGKLVDNVEAVCTPTYRLGGTGKRPLIIITYTVLVIHTHMDCLTSR